MTDRSLRPMSLGDIFDEGFDLYKKNLSLFLLAAAVVIAPWQIFCAYMAPTMAADGNAMYAAIFGNGVQNTNAPQYYDSAADLGRSMGLPSLLFLLAYPLAICAVTWCASQRYLGHPVGIGQAYRHCIRRYPSMLITGLIYTIVVSIGFTLCALPGIWALVVWILTPQTFTIEGRRYFGAIKRSNALVSGDGGRVLGCILLLCLLGGTIYLGFSLPITYIFQVVLKLAPNAQGALSGGPLSSSMRANAAADVAGGLTALLIMPFFITVLTVLYYDLRVRKEAFDVELLALGLGYKPFDEEKDYLPPALATPAVGVSYIPAGRVQPGRSGAVRQPPGTPPTYGGPTYPYGQAPYGAQPPGQWGQPSPYGPQQPGAPVQWGPQSQQPYGQQPYGGAAPQAGQWGPPPAAPNPAPSPTGGPAPPGSAPTPPAANPPPPAGTDSPGGTP